jgi:predicted nucleic acid-binding protein
MLEAEWVLRSVYAYQPGDVCRALRAFAGLPGVSVEEEALVATALDRAERGMDFADALHLGEAGHGEAMVTFDRKFIKAAKAVGVATVREA